MQGRTPANHTMEVVKTKCTPSDNPAMSVNSPPARALAQGFFFGGGQIAFHHRSELSGPIVVPECEISDSTRNTRDSTSEFKMKNSDSPLGVIPD